MATYGFKQPDGTWIYRKAISAPIHATMLAYTERTSMFRGRFHDEAINPNEIWEDCDE